MSEKSAEAGASGPSRRSVEIGVALFILTLGVIAIVGSLAVGIGWGIEGPRAGFVPFYVGLFIVIASLINLARALLIPNDEKLFVEWRQFRRVMSVIAPATLYVALVPSIGIYVSSMLMIAVFMKWLGGYRWHFVLAVAAGVTIVVYIVFEKWFLLPMPKGPVEDFLGL